MSKSIPLKDFNGFVAALKTYIQKLNSRHGEAISQIINVFTSNAEKQVSFEARETLIRNIIRYTFMNTLYYAEERTEIIKLLNQFNILGHPSTIPNHRPTEYDEARTLVFYVLDYFQLITYASDNDDNGNDNDDTNNDDNGNDEEQESETKEELVKDKATFKVTEIYTCETFKFSANQARQLGVVLNRLIPLEDIATSMHIADLIISPTHLNYMHILAEYFDFKFEIENEAILSITIDFNN